MVVQTGILPDTWNEVPWAGQLMSVCTTTGEEGEDSPTLRLHERKNKPESLDSPARDEGDQCKGIYAEVSDVQTIVEDISFSSSSSSCSEKEGSNETTGIAEAALSRVKRHTGRGYTVQGMMLSSPRNCVPRYRTICLFAHHW